jgi:hypothetical protein
MMRVLRFLSGGSVFILAAAWSAVFFLALRYQPGLRPFHVLRLIELGIIWHVPIIFSLVGACLLIAEALRPKQSAALVAELPR